MPSFRDLKKGLRNYKEQILPEKEEALSLSAAKLKFEAFKRETGGKASEIMVTWLEQMKRDGQMIKAPDGPEIDPDDALKAVRAVNENKPLQDERSRTLIFEAIREMMRRVERARPVATLSTDLLMRRHENLTPADRRNIESSLLTHFLVYPDKQEGDMTVTQAYREMKERAEEFGESLGKERQEMQRIFKLYGMELDLTKIRTADPEFQSAMSQVRTAIREKGWTNAFFLMGAHSFSRNRLGKKIDNLTEQLRWIEGIEENLKHAAGVVDIIARRQTDEMRALFGFPSLAESPAEQVAPAAERETESQGAEDEEEKEESDITLDPRLEGLTTMREQLPLILNKFRELKERDIQPQNRGEWEANIGGLIELLRNLVDPTEGALIGALWQTHGTGRRGRRRGGMRRRRSGAVEST